MTAVHRNVRTQTHTHTPTYLYMHLFVHTSEHSGTRQYNWGSNSSLRPTAISYAHAHLSYICLLLPPPLLLNLLASFRMHFSCIVSILQCVTRCCCCCTWCLCCCLCLCLCRCLGTLRLPPGAQNLGHYNLLTEPNNRFGIA